MPTYNGQRYLSHALESIASQRRNDVEVVLVDDGSTDATLSIARSFAGRLNLSIHVVPHTGNWVANTNVALAHARAEYATILHQDDFWLDERVALTRRAVTSHPSVRFFTCDAVFVGPDGRRLSSWPCPLPAGLVDPRTFLDRILIQNNLASGAPVFLRRWVIDMGGLDEDMWYTADWDLWLKAGSSMGAYHLPTPLVAFRVHPMSQTSSRDAGPILRSQMLAVLHRYNCPFAPGSASPRFAQAARCSLEVNAVLASLMRRERPAVWPLLRSFRELRLTDAIAFLRYSQLLRRAYVRVRVAIRSHLRLFAEPR